MRFTDIEAKLARLAINASAHDGEAANAGGRFFLFLKRRGIRAEQFLNGNSPKKESTEEEFLRKLLGKHAARIAILEADLKYAQARAAEIAKINDDAIAAVKKSEFARTVAEDRLATAENLLSGLQRRWSEFTREALRVAVIFLATLFLIAILWGLKKDNDQTLQLRREQQAAGLRSEQAWHEAQDAGQGEREEEIETSIRTAGQITTEEADRRIRENTRAYREAHPIN